MGRGATTDSAGLADTTLVLNGGSENKSIEKAEAMDAQGNVVARATYNPLSAPTTDYAVIGTFGLAGITLGTKSASNNVLTGFNITTAAGSFPTISTTEQSVPAESAQEYTFTTPTADILGTKTAQILFAAFTLTGTGCHLNGCSATGSCTLASAADADGVMIAFGVHGAKIEVTAEIVQTGATAPTVTAATDWIITSPLTMVEVNTDFKKGSVTLEYIPTAVAPV